MVQFVKSNLQFCYFCVLWWAEIVNTQYLIKKITANISFFKNRLKLTVFEILKLIKIHTYQSDILSISYVSAKQVLLMVLLQVLNTHTLTHSKLYYLLYYNNKRKYHNCLLNDFIFTLKILLNTWASRVFVT